MKTVKKNLLIGIVFLLVNTGYAQVNTDSTGSYPNPLDSVVTKMNIEYDNVYKALLKQTEVYQSRHLQGYIEALEYVWKLMRIYKLIK